MKINKANAFWLAVLLPFLACGLQLLTWNVIQPFVWFFFYPAVYISSWLGGRNGGLIATALAIGLAVFFFIPPLHTFGIQAPHYWLTTWMFAGMGIIFAFTQEYLQTTFSQRLETLEQLRRNEKEMTLAVEAAQLGVWRWDLASNHIDATPLFRQIFGLADDVPIDYITIMDMVHPEDRPQFWTNVPTALAVRENQKVLEYRIIRPDGTERWIRSQLQFSYSDDQRSQKCNGVVMDVTEQKLASLDLDRLRILMAEGERIAHFGCWEYVAEEQAIRWSAEQYRIFGIDPATSVPDYATLLRKHVHPDDAGRVDCIFRNALETPGCFELEHRLIRTEGLVRVVKSVAEPIVDESGKLVKYVGITLDVTDQNEVEEKLRQSEQRLRLATEGGRIGTWYRNIRTDRMEMSLLCREHLGLPHGPEMDFSQIFTFMHPGDRELVIKAIPVALREHRGFEFQYRISREDGSYRWIEARGRGIYNDVGECEATIGTTIDITERKQSEANLLESENRFRFLFENLPVAYQSLDAQGRWLDVNQQAADLLGFNSPEEMLGKYFPDCWDESTRDSFENKYDRFKTEGKTEGQLTLRRRDGTPVVVQISGRIQRDSSGQFVRTHCVLLDISERYRMEQKIRALNESLEKRVEERTTELQDALAIKSQFLANMSHEIRNPLNSISLSTHLLTLEPLTDMQKSSVEKIGRASASLVKVVNEILDYSKIEAGQVTLETACFSVQDLLRNVHDLLSAQAAAKGLRFNIDTPPEMDCPLLGDMHRLQQVLINLASNAIKFTDQGEVRIMTTVLSNSPHTITLRFDVSDTGIGMSPDILGILFKPFSQADSSITRRYGGTGLGLSISQRLVGLMGGTIRVRSTPGMGTLFWFEVVLPKGNSRPVLSAADVEQEGTVLQGIRILAVDDDQENLDGLKMSLENKGATVTTAADGLVAIQYLTENPSAFDIVLMDIQMPVMDGLTATETIRDSLRLTEIPIIAVTAGILPDQQQKALASGINHLVCKPVELPELVRLISIYVKRQKRDSALSTGSATPREPDQEPVAQTLLRDDRAG